MGGEIVRGDRKVETLREDYRMPILSGPLPDDIRHIHILGICGTAMGALAGMLVDAGYTVTGSDTGVYPPMSDYLQSLGIEIKIGFLAENLDPKPDLVVIGNVIRKVYEEAQAVLDRDLLYCSFPQILGERFLAQSRSIVFSGTHGKTTTTAITAWLADAAGLEPGYLVGGVVKGWDRTARRGAGTHFVIEGDEYDTAFFDKGPKFLHYRATTAVITSVEFDHADIYRDLAHVQESFKKLVAGLSEKEGLIIARTDHATVREVIVDAPCEIWGYGKGQEWDGRVDATDHQLGTMTFTVTREGEAIGQFTTRLVGEHNLYNQVAAVAALVREGVSVEALQKGFSTFKGIRRRQEVRGEPGGITVVDDFAHHPTAVKVTLDALRMRFGQRRLWTIFEPRTNTSKRKLFQAAYTQVFGASDRVIIASPGDQSGIDDENKMSSAKLAADLRTQGIEAFHMDSVDEIVATLGANTVEADVVAIFSNGAFGGIHEKLLSTLQDRFALNEPN
jgi:UDP-N-acetylmuramate: L-alanyl-gamma-D-glutamyl-meso-diaminopimelate ligase